MERPGPGRLEQILAIVSMVPMVWFMLPEHQRRLLLMQAANQARLLMAWLARAEGHAGMGDELAGRDPAARYNGAYALACARDWLARLPERWRP